MQWLPAIRFQNAGWLLPLSSESAAFLASLLCDTSDQHGPLADSDSAAEAMLRCLTRDPGLTIFSLLELLARHRDAAAKSFDLESHASWFCQVVPDLFLDRNRQLLTMQLAAQLESTKPEALSSQCWNKLVIETGAAPTDQWMMLASRWLAVSGNLPPQDWSEKWPRLEPADSFVTELFGSSEAKRTTNASVDAGQEHLTRGLEYGQTSLDLYRLARNQHELRQLRERFASRLQVEKMASLRQLAYGLSHEINNPLASIRMRAEQLITTERQEARQGQLRRIVDAAMRSHEMIADMMYFAMPPKPRLEKVDPWRLTTEVVEQSRSDAERCDIRIATAGETPRGKRAGRLKSLHCDPRQVSDALRALVRNAIEAIGTRGSVSVMVQASGRRVAWTVTDSGPGLTPEARRHAFDPYFSGREAGRGLGLGLCRVYRVARAHGGGASIEDTEVGCRARMWVPIKSQN